MVETEVAIVGGGVSGLSVAYELQQRSVPFLLLEHANRLGGIMRTDRVDGFTIDAGPDSLLVQKPAAINLCRELGLGARLLPTSPPRTAYVVRKGLLCPLPRESVLGIPTSLWSLVRNELLSPSGKFQMSLDLMHRSGRVGGEDDESVATFFARHFGQQAVDYIAEPLLAGIHAGDVNKLSMQVLFPRLVETERKYGSVIRGLQSLRAPKSSNGIFRSLPGGLEELVSALVGSLAPESVKAGAGVLELGRADRFNLNLSTGDIVRARQVVLTVPAYITADLVNPIDTTLATLCRGIPYTSTATVALSYPRAAVRHHLNGTGFVVPRVERDIELMAGSWVSSKWPGRAPRGQVLLRGFMGGIRNPDVLSHTDEEIIKAAHHDLTKLLGITVPPTLKRVYRWPLLNPQHQVHHLVHLAKIDEQLKRHSGLHLAGAGFRGVGIPDCVAASRSTAATVAAQR